MNGGTTRLIEVLREELAPYPGRWRQAILTSLGTTTALGLIVALQIGSFVAPAVAYMALQPNVVCTWRGFFRRLLIAALAGVVLLYLGGVVVQLPWVMLPFFFAAVSLLSYFVSISSRPLETMAVMYSVVMVFVTGIFNPHAMGTVTLEVVCAYAVGLLTGTAFAQLVVPQRPRDRLAAALAAGFAGARQRLCAVAARYRATAASPPQAVVAPPSLASYLQLFDLVRQERAGVQTERALLAFMIAVERTQVAIRVAEGLADEAVPRAYRQLLDRELAELLAELDTALGRFADVVGSADRVAVAAATGTTNVPWPDLPRAVHAVEARQLALRHAGLLASTGVGEAANTNAFVQVVKSLADVLHTAPEALAHMAAVESTPDLVAPPRLAVPRFDPYAARWALQVGLGVTVAFVLVVVSHVHAFFTALWNPLFIAQSSYGATIRRSGLRILGVFLGAAIAMLVISGIMPNITGITALLVLFLVVLIPCQYVALSSPRIAYVGVQVAFTFILVVVAEQPMTDEHAALWRAFGTLVGTACLFGVFRLVAPDYAGRQLIARFRDLMASILVLLPKADAAPLPASRLLAVRRDIGTCAADIMRLADEARVEGHQSGVAPQAAVEAVGLATRIAHRTVLIHRGRILTPWPPLTTATQAVLVAAERVMREYVELLLRMLQARHTAARPGSRAYRGAVQRAAVLAAIARPDLSQTVEVLTRRLDAVRFSEFADWPPSASGALFAELEHLQRICDMLPKLDIHLVEMSHAKVVADAAGTAAVPRPVVAA